MSPSHAKFDHEAHARACAEDDFWRQIRRTVQGQPVGEAQIRMIVAEVRSRLALATGDQLLDLACGNGALAQRLLDGLAGYLGVDAAPTLIKVANRHFARPNAAFVEQDVGDYVAAEPAPQRFSKVLCYGSFAYFSPATAETVLRLLHQRFDQVSRVFIGNLPDRERASLFLAPRPPDPAELADHESAIGIWRTPQEMIELAHACGWHASVSRMPATYYAAHYRFDLLLERRP